MSAEPLDPAAIMAMRARDARYGADRITNGIGSPIMAAQDRRDLLGEVGRLVDEVATLREREKRVRSEHKELRSVFAFVKDRMDQFAYDELSTLIQESELDDPTEACPRCDDPDCLSADHAAPERCFGCGEPDCIGAHAPMSPAIPLACLAVGLVAGFKLARWCLGESW